MNDGSAKALVLSFFLFFLFFFVLLTETIPLSPSLRISFLKLDFLPNSLVRLLILESWSASENLTSRSLGVIKSKLKKSVIFPHLVATWLSATLKVFFGIALVRSGMLFLLKTPCLKSLKITTSQLFFLIADDILFKILSEIGWLSNVSIFKSL